jgi:ABC-type lipoprotein export system ATPase subunit
VLKGVSLQIDTGSFVAIMGPSGAGKSTLLHLLAGLDTPTSGEVLWNGKAVSRLSDAERSAFRNRMLGIVFQFYHLLPELSALENVTLPGLVNAHKTDGTLRARARACLEHVGLGARLRHRPRELSGGEQQRVAIARALVNEPSVLFCDEPTGNLDSKTGAEVIDLLVGLHRQHRVGLVLVTHQAKLAEMAEAGSAKK